MALSQATVTSRLSSSAATALSLSNKFYKIIQNIPSAVIEYTDFAEQILNISCFLEQIGQVIPILDLADGCNVFEDIVKLLGFLDDAFVDSKEGLPSKTFDGIEVDLLLPFEVETLLQQIEALGIGSNMIICVLSLGANQRASGQQGLNISPSMLVVEGFVNQVRRMVRTLKLTQPKETNVRRGVSSKRAKTHAAITQWLSRMLQDNETFAQEIGTQDAEVESPSKDEDPMKLRTETSELEKVNTVQFDSFGQDPLNDGMPPYIRHRSDQVYAKIHKKDLDKRTLDFHGLPWSMLKDDANFFIIWKHMEGWECDNLFAHTKKLRINEEQSAINANTVTKSLLLRWANVEESAPAETAPAQDDESRRFDNDLRELVQQDEKPCDQNRPLARERSFSPPPWPPRPRSHAPRYHDRHSRHRDVEGKTEYWRSWGNQTAKLYLSLRMKGWQPVYMRGTDDGQTWFYGPDVVHVRRFKNDYTPQDGPVQIKDGNKPKEYLIISTEWVEEEAMSRSGFQYELLPSGHFSIDPRITWGDIELLTGATSTFREERLYRKYRDLPGGDLHDVHEVAVPTKDFLHGPQLCAFRAKGQETATSGVKDADTSEKQASNHEESSADAFVEITK